MKIVVAYDGTLQSKEALANGIATVREKGGEVLALHVFKSNLFVDYDVMDAETKARRDGRRIVEEAKAFIREKGEGVRAALFTTEGNAEEEVFAFAASRKADLLLCPSRFKTSANKHRNALNMPEMSRDTAKINHAALSAKTL